MPLLCICKQLCTRSLTLRLSLQYLRSECMRMKQLQFILVQRRHPRPEFGVGEHFAPIFPQSPTERPLDCMLTRGRSVVSNAQRTVKHRFLGAIIKNRPVQDAPQHWKPECIGLKHSNHAANAWVAVLAMRLVEALLPKGCRTPDLPSRHT